MTFSIRSASLAAVCSLAMVGAHASLVTVQFNGVVDAGGEFGVVAGTALTGQFVYDTNALPSATGATPTESSFAFYTGNAFEIDVDGMDKVSASLTLIDLSIPSQPASGTPQLGVSGQSFITHDGGLTFSVKSLSLLLAGLYAEGLKLPDHIDSSQWSITQTGSIQGSQGAAQALTYHLTSISSVPEPTTALLSGLGLIGVLVGARRQHKAQPSV